MVIRSDYMIVGTGPSALLHYLNLKKLGRDVLLVGTELYGQLKPMVYSEIRKPVNLLPIFPVYESELWKKLNTEHIDKGPLTLKKLNLYGAQRQYPKNQNCYYNYLLQHQQKSNVPYILSYKQFGGLIFEHQLTELQKKVNRNYSSGRQKFQKAGFVNGLSPYYLHLKSYEPYPVIQEQVQFIDYSEKTLHTSNNTIHYNHLIYTIPLYDLFGVTNLQKSFELVSGDAKFLIFFSNKTLPENHLWYCCNIQSNIYRAFVPHENIIVVQLSRKSWNVEPKEIGNELRNLLNIERELFHIDTKTYSGCYPLEVYGDDKKEELTDFMRGFNFYFSGRFAEWRYIDLHEVDFEPSTKIMEVVSNVGYD